VSYRRLFLKLRLAAAFAIDFVDRQPTPVTTVSSALHSLCAKVLLSTRNAWTMPAGDYTDLHELAKGWKAAIARATDPATK
jgi:hypothetical protein